MEFLGEASSKAVFVGSLEMVCSEVLVGETSVEHDVDGGEHGCGHRDDGLLGAAAGSEPEEQRLRIAGLDPHGRPGALDEQGLEPGGTVTKAGRAALARTLVILGPQPAQETRWAGVGKRRMSKPISDRMTLADTLLTPGI